MRAHILSAALASSLLCALPASAEVVVRAERTNAGIAIDWTGAAGASDVIAIDLAAIRAKGAAADVDLGTVRSIECGSSDATTRGGFEDAATGGSLVGYLVGSGGDYGPSGDGKARRVAAGDCSGGPLTKAQFCQRWRDDSRIDSIDPWSGNPDPQGCDAGVVDPVAIADALRRTNLYRWMCGLSPVTIDPVLAAKCQDGAVLLRGLGYLDHQPLPDAPCYTPTGDAACGSSNICAGYPTLADAVDAYLGDFGIDTLGHRRWLLHPPLSTTGFGFVQGTGTYATQWIIGSGSTNLPPFVAWPSAGWFPGDAPVGTWSFSVKGADFSAATVSVTRVADGQPMAVSGVGQLPNGYSWSCLGYRVAGVQAGNDYRVVVDGVRGTPQARYEYVTQWCNCSN